VCIHSRARATTDAQELQYRCPNSGGFRNGVENCFFKSYTSLMEQRMNQKLLMIQYPHAIPVFCFFVSEPSINAPTFLGTELLLKYKFISEFIRASVLGRGAFHTSPVA